MSDGATTAFPRHVNVSTMTLLFGTPISDTKVLTDYQKPTMEVLFLFAEIAPRTGTRALMHSYSRRAGGLGQYATLRRSPATWSVIGRLIDRITRSCCGRVSLSAITDLPCKPTPLAIMFVTVDANQQWDWPTALRLGPVLAQFNLARFEEARLPPTPRVTPSWPQPSPGYVLLPRVKCLLPAEHIGLIGHHSAGTTQQHAPRIDASPSFVWPP